MLTEHFRCLPPIIAFSNAHAYNHRIIPLRDQPPHPGWAALGAVKVLDGYRIGMVNEPEADAVVDLIAELCANPDYDGMTMGVISLLGSTQSKLIWDKLYDRVGPEVMTQRELRSGEPANFQGDERDVIVISTVVAVDPANPIRPAIRDDQQPCDAAHQRRGLPRPAADVGRSLPRSRQIRRRRSARCSHQTLPGCWHDDRAV